MAAQRDQLDPCPQGTGSSRPICATGTGRRRRSHRMVRLPQARCRAGRAGSGPRRQKAVSRSADPGVRGRLSFRGAEYGKSLNLLVSVLRILQINGGLRLCKPPVRTAGRVVCRGDGARSRAAPAGRAESRAFQRRRQCLRRAGRVRRLAETDSVAGHIGYEVRRETGKE
jgi:hypothetical protein